jgi:hypothetical protein
MARDRFGNFVRAVSFWLGALIWLWAPRILFDLTPARSYGGLFACMGALPARGVARRKHTIPFEITVSPANAVAFRNNCIADHIREPGMSISFSSQIKLYSPGIIVARERLPNLMGLLRELNPGPLAP